ncbi:MAG: amino acid adenylation domain-containing protein [Mucilaginibacter sp.]|nr:amino acid adenylation domain-containing protein [Mucilaginibacter sp.]
MQKSISQNLDSQISVGADEIISHNAYWLKQFEGELPVLDWPLEKNHGAVDTYNAESQYINIEKEIAKKLNDTSESPGGTLYISLLACVNALFYRYTGQEDIIIGGFVTVPEQSDQADQTVTVDNVLPFRTRFNGAGTYSELFQHVREVALNAFEHRQYTYNELVDTLNQLHKTDRRHLFNVMVLLQTAARHGDHPKTNNQADVSFIFSESEDGLILKLDYNTEVYDEGQAKRMLQHLKNIITAVAYAPDQNLTTIELVSDEEKKQLLEEFNDITAIQLPTETIIAQFEKQAAQNPDTGILAFGETELTYRELNEISNQLANYLRANYHIEADDLVGILLNRSEWMVIAMLGVLKSGAAYVPIDPFYPDDRISYMLEDSKCKVMINPEELDKFKQQQNNYSKQNPSHISGLSNLAYVLYTSGSTGKPKGVMVEHGNLACFNQNITERFGFKPGMKLAALTTYTFDISVLELLGTLSVGVHVHVMDEIDPLQILVQLNEHQINILQLTPSRLKQLTAVSSCYSQLSTLDILIIGGEALPEKMYNDLRKELPQVSVLNGYGPTEATIFSTCLPVHDSTKVNIGKPLIGEYVYVLNERGQLLPIGVAGELHISGTGITRGYLNRPELTAEKFVANPFRPGERMYKTGDIGRWLPDGNIECMGRIDDQVKIRGFRIELDEISAVLQTHNAVKEAVVVARVVTGQERELIAYTTGNAEPSELRNFLKEQLPKYMVPTYYVNVAVIPLTSNGKIDRKSLPMPDERHRPQLEHFTAAVTDTEKKLAIIWQEILNMTRIGIDDDFFDLGGSSMVAIRTINKINSTMRANVTVASLYQLPTIRQLAERIDSHTIDKVSPVFLLKEGVGMPIFVFPPWSSYPAIFNYLVYTFKGENPLYGIIYTEDTEHFPFKNLQEYVGYLIPFMKQLYPDSPYGLVGYSMGARTILEVAVQLQRANHKIGLLAAISYFPSFPAKGMLLSRRMRDEIRVFNYISPGNKFRYLHTRIPHLLKLAIKGQKEGQDVKVDVETQNKVLDLHEQYEPTDKYNGDMVLIYESSPDGHWSEYKKIQVYRNSIFKKLWAEHINGNVSVEIIDTKHVDFFKLPAVKNVVDVIESYLKK